MLTLVIHCLKLKVIFVVSSFHSLIIIHSILSLSSWCCIGEPYFINSFNISLSNQYIQLL